jgi:AcrR family transcriptional regulator
VGERNQRHERLRATIEATAFRLFSEKGFDAVSVEEIARASGVSRATVFRHFPSKDAIFFAACPRRLERLESFLRERPEARESVGALQEAVCAYADVLEAEGDDIRQRLGVVAGDHRLRTLSLSHRERAVQVVTAWMAGEGVPSLRQEVLGSVVVDSLATAVRRWYQAGAVGHLRSYVEEFFTAVLQLGS